MIYFMTARDIGRVKIGRAAHPETRLAQLQTGCPAKLVIEATLDGDHKLEAALHQAFRRLRTHGEWFEMDPAVEMAIHWINSGDPIPENAEEYLMSFLFKSPARTVRITSAQPAPEAVLPLATSGALLPAGEH